MENGFLFLLNSVLLGAGLAMDAFSVSLANGLAEPEMTGRRMGLIAGTYGFFQALMPMLGWICVHTIMRFFSAFEKWIPWIALALLGYIGVKMIVEGIRHHTQGEMPSAVTFGTLMVQGIATSIDALSVGFTIADYSAWMALIASLIIAAVTFGICIGGLILGRKFGTKLSDKATIVGGCILVFIGIEIFVSNLFF